MTAADDTNETSGFAAEYARARSGDRAAMDLLMRRFEPAVAEFVGRHCRNEVRRRVAPEDVVQEVLMTFLRRLETFPENLDAAGLAGFLIRIARWRIADVLKRGKLVVGESAIASFDPADSVPTQGPVTRSDENHYLAGLIGKLREQHREVLECTVLAAMSTAEAASHLGLREDAVRQRIARARRELGRLMNRES